MNQLITTTASILTAIACLCGANVLAGLDPDDYTGTSRIQTTADRPLGARASSTDFALLEAAAKIPACEVIEDHFDYSGTQQVRCSTDGTPQETEWSYLY